MGHGLGDLLPEPELRRARLVPEAGHVAKVRPGVRTRSMLTMLLDSWISLRVALLLVLELVPLLDGRPRPDPRHRSASAGLDEVEGDEVEDEASDGTWISAKAPHSSCHSGPWEECDRADDVAGHSPGISAKAPHRVRDAAPDEVVHGSSQCTPRHQQSPPTTTTLRRRA